MAQPTWSQGDYWVYHVSLGMKGTGSRWMEVEGTETITVGGISYLCYRLAVASRETSDDEYPTYTNLTGTAWYRVSDLAFVREELSGTLRPPWASAEASYARTLEFDPPERIIWPLSSTVGWDTSTIVRQSSTYEGLPTEWRNATAWQTWRSGGDYPLEVVAGAFSTTPLTGSYGYGGSEYSNTTYWSPVAGNGVLVTTRTPYNLEARRLELVAYQHRPGSSDTSSPDMTGVSATPSIQVPDGYLTVSAVVIDDVAVARVSLNITLPDGTHVSRAMTGDASDEYSFTAMWTQPGTYPFTVWAVDTSGNGVSRSGSFVIEAPPSDATPPTITHTPPPTAYVGEAILITANVTDSESEVSGVRLLYTPVGGAEENVTMTLSGGLYTYTIPGQLSVGLVRYRIYAIDAPGNARLTQDYAVSVQTRAPSTPFDLALAVTLVGIGAFVAVLAVVLFLARRRKMDVPPPRNR